MGTLTHNPQADTIALGRSMEYRVIPYAKGHGYGYYKALPGSLYELGEGTIGTTLNERAHVWVNRKWLNFQVMEGKQFVDIGAPNPAIRPEGVKPLSSSAYYDAEHRLLSETVGRRTLGGPYSTDSKPSWDLGR